MSERPGEVRPQPDRTPLLTAPSTWAGIYVLLAVLVLLGVRVTMRKLTL